MNIYLINFAVYTLAMIGFIAVALFIYKKSIYSGTVSKNKDFLRVENSLRLSAAKTVYVLKAGNERFLIAGDAANTTMLAKLNENSAEYINCSDKSNDKITEFAAVKKPLHKMNRG